MEKTYYTPDINEFHVGFEFEHYFQNHPVLKNGWDSDIITGGTRLMCISDYISENRIRIPYLSKEDIESEGWVFSNKSNINNFVFDKLPLRMNVCFYDGSDNTPHISVYSESVEILNRIKIKNKSEFKNIIQRIIY